MTETVPGMPEPGRCLVMGVVNVTPDSFSDGGAWFERDAAIRHGLELAADGADLVDVGGESTRPGAVRVSRDEELRRVIPVVEALAAEGVCVSVDTMRAQVARAAIEVGARLVNDVSGGLADPDMPKVVGRARVPYVVMHWRGHSHDMATRAIYHDVVAEVTEELRKRVAAVVAEGVDPEMIIVDPGLGFAKDPEIDHDWRLLAHLEALKALGRPVLVAASRKRFLRRLAAGAGSGRHPFSDSDDATVALTALAAAAGAWCVRVHRARSNADAVRVAAAWTAAAQDAVAGNAAREART